MKTQYDHEVTFRAWTVDPAELEMVDVHVTFNINYDDIEVQEFSQLVFKKCFGIELGHVTAVFVQSQKEYVPTKEDLRDWKHDIQEAMMKEFKRQTA